MFFFKDNNTRFLDLVGQTAPAELSVRFVRERSEMLAKTEEAFSRYAEWGNRRPGLLEKLVKAMPADLRISEAGRRCLAILGSPAVVPALSENDLILLFEEAMRSEDLTLVRRLLDNIDRWQVKHCLYIATQSMNLDIVNAVLECKRFTQYELFYPYAQGENSLRLAVRNGCDIFVERFFERGADLSWILMQDLVTAYDAGHRGVLATIRTRGGDSEAFRELINQLWQEGHLNLAWFMESGQWGAIPGDRIADYVHNLLDGEIAFSLQNFLNLGLSVNGCDGRGRSLLMRYSDMGNSDAVQALLGAGASIDLEDFEHRTALHHSVRLASTPTQITRSLLDAGAEVNCEDALLQTPLMLACRNGHVGQVTLLLDAGADINRRDRNGETPLQIACQFHRMQLVILLLERGARWNKTSFRGQDTAKSVLDERFNRSAGYAGEALEAFASRRDPIAKLYLLQMGEELKQPIMETLEGWIRAGDPDDNLVKVLSHPCLANKVVVQPDLLKRILTAKPGIVQRIAPQGRLELAIALNLSPGDIAQCVRDIPAEERSRRQQQTRLIVNRHTYSVREGLVRLKEDVALDIPYVRRGVEQALRDMTSFSISLAAADPSTQSLVADLVQLLDPKHLRLCIPQFPKELFLRVLKAFPTALSFATDEQLVSYAEEFVAMADPAAAEALTAFEKRAIDLDARSKQQPQPANLVQLYKQLCEDVTVRGLKRIFHAELDRLEGIKIHDHAKGDVQHKIKQELVKAQANLSLLLQRVDKLSQWLEGPLAKAVGATGEVEVPNDYCCPITLEVMRDPVIDKYGHSYERDAIVRWIRDYHRSPLTNQPLEERDLKTNDKLREDIQRFLKENAGKIKGEGPAAPKPIIEDAEPIEVESSDSEEDVSDDEVEENLRGIEEPLDDNAVIEENRLQAHSIFAPLARFWERYNNAQLD